MSVVTWRSHAEPSARVPSSYAGRVGLPALRHSELRFHRFIDQLVDVSPLSSRVGEKHGGPALDDLLLDCSVSNSGCSIGTKVVSERQIAYPMWTAPLHHVQVERRLCTAAKIEPSWDASLSERLIAAPENRDGRCLIGWPTLEANHQVDDVLGRKIGYGCTADVFDVCLRKSGPHGQACSLGNELLRPFGRVRYKRDGFVQ